MKKYRYKYIPILVFLLYACSSNLQGDLLEIAVNTNRDGSLQISEITEEMTAIELELTDESLINSDMIVRIIITENNIIVAESSIVGLSKVLVFNQDGTFVRSIGSRGQGPGEFNIISNIAFDDKSNRLFMVNSQPNKIICYDLEGKFVKESRFNCPITDINYINGELLLNCLCRRTSNHASNVLYRMNESFQIIDSCIRWENYYERATWMDLNLFKANIVQNNTFVYLYSNDIYPKQYAPEVKVLRDTLYRVEDNQLIPELKLKFKNDGFDSAGDKIIDLFNIWRSSRYVFAVYMTDNKTRYYFCYDTKTGKGYNIPDGYTDDINGIEKPVSIRPLHTDSETFYYWHTHMKPDDREEPNPTLYIIKLKK